MLTAVILAFLNLSRFVFILIARNLVFGEGEEGSCGGGWGSRETIRTQSRPIPEVDFLPNLLPFQLGSGNSGRSSASGGDLIIVMKTQVRSKAPCFVKSVDRII